eukprot:7151059-Alexandrium_andersonii.AAC.1
MPVGVGSGRADARYKVHALLHSERLASESWGDAVRLMNSTFSWTGDLGTESRLPSVRVAVRDLLPWAFPQPDAMDAPGPDSPRDSDAFLVEPLPD